jgi:hypothetical protein
MTYIFIYVNKLHANFLEVTKNPPGTVSKEDEKT